MEIIAASNDPVRISFLMVSLRDAKLDPVLYDSNMAAMLGTAGPVQQRVAVPQAQAWAARRVLKESGLE